jgi:hypothetical protein
MELKSKNNYELHLNEISSLKVKIQHIKTKNRVLKSTNILKNDIELDLSKLYVGQNLMKKWVLC